MKEESFKKIFDLMDAKYRASTVRTSRSAEHAQAFTSLAYQYWPQIKYRLQDHMERPRDA